MSIKLPAVEIPMIKEDPMPSSRAYRSFKMDEVAMLIKAAEVRCIDQVWQDVIERLIKIAHIPGIKTMPGDVAILSLVDAFEKGLTDTRATILRNERKL